SFGRRKIKPELLLPASLLHNRRRAAFRHFLPKKWNAASGDSRLRCSFKRGRHRLSRPNQCERRQRLAATIPAPADRARSTRSATEPPPNLATSCKPVV